MTTTLTERHKIIIIGAGAAGMMAACSSCDTFSSKGITPDVILLEKNDCAGKKITATGNGKCNFTNLMQLDGCYRSETPQLVPDIINSFDEQQTIRFFEKTGVLCYERDGYCYPLSEQAKSVRDALEYRLFKAGARIHYNKTIENIELLSAVSSMEYCDGDGIVHNNCNDGMIPRFRISCTDKEKHYEAEKLIICCGGKASPVFGSDGALIELIRKMGISIVKPLPSLCGLKLSDALVKNLDGVRVRCLSTLYLDCASDCKSLMDANKVYSEHGEIIFNKSGVSGIPILNLSRYAVSAVESGRSAILVIDFFASDTEQELFDYLYGLITTLKLPPMKCFCGIMNDRLLRQLLICSGIKPEEKMNLSDDAKLRNSLSQLVSVMKCFRLSVNGYQGFDNAQTTQGGVRLDSVDSKMMSKLIPGLYFAGEVLDVDGKCGGYNLQWAWSTGHIAGRSAASEE